MSSGTGRDRYMLRSQTEAENVQEPDRGHRSISNREPGLVARRLDLSTHSIVCCCSDLRPRGWTSFIESGIRKWEWLNADWP